MKKGMLIGIAVVAVGVAFWVAFWVGLRGPNFKATKDSPPSSKATADKQKERVAQAQSMKSVDLSEFIYTEGLLSDAVKALLGLDGEQHNYNYLKDAISKLSKNLSADDVAALREMLTWPNDQFPEGMRAIEINAVKNDVLDRLLRQNVLPEGIGQQMVEMASNSDNDPVWRDYCIQFCPTAWERIEEKYRIVNGESGISKDLAGGSQASATAGSEATAPPHELKAIQEAMFSALDERDSTIAGTSLIGLELLSRTHEEFDRDAIVDAALDIASDESASAESRLTALRLSAGVGATENTEYTASTTETARLLAQTGETVLLRSAAIVTLGEIGTDADRELLESFAVSESRQIAMAAEMALAKMDARN